MEFVYVAIGCFVVLLIAAANNISNNDRWYGF